MLEHLQIFKYIAVFVLLAKQLLYSLVVNFLSGIFSIVDGLSVCVCHSIVRLSLFGLLKMSFTNTNMLTASYM